MRTYKLDEWDFRIGECGYFDTMENIYVDNEEKLITGILEDFYFFSKGDPQNNVYVENGRRVD